MVLVARDLRAACGDSAGSADEVVARAQTEGDPQKRPLWSRLVGSELFSLRWQTAATMAVSLGVVSLALLAGWHLKSSMHIPAHGDATTPLRFATQHGEQQTHRLDDNSVLHLNTDSSVTIRYGRSERVIDLTAGEADFEVAHEPDRPFRVRAGSAEVVDIGTRFDVRLERDTTTVTVIDGRVAVRPASQGDDAGVRFSRKPSVGSVELIANQQIRVAAGAWPAGPITVDAHRTTAWLYRQIMFEREPLEIVAGEFNRYTTKPIEITSPALRHLEISGVFETDDTEAFIAFLRSLDGVRVEVTAKQIRVSQD